MKRKLISLILIVLLLPHCIFPALADDTGLEREICASYWNDGILYTFARFMDEDSISQKAKLLVDNVMMDETYPKTISEAGGKLHFMLLIDNSSSMPNYRYQILRFADAIMNSHQNIEISVASFDNQFSITAEEMTQWDDVKKALQSLTYSRDGSDIGGSVAAAIEYLGSKGYDAGEMCNLIVVTDGEPWYSNSTILEQEMEDQAKQEAATMMAQCPEIVVHSYSFGKWKSDISKILQYGKGVHCEEGSAIDAGTLIAEFADSVYSIEFKLSGYDIYDKLPGSFMMVVGNSILSFGTVRNVNILPDENIDISPETYPEEEPTEPTGSADPTEGTESMQPTEPTAGTESTESTEASDSSEETSESVGSTENVYDQATNPTDDSISSDEYQNSKRPALDFTLILFVGLIAACILFLGFLALSRKNKHTRNHTVRMRIEVISGVGIRVKELYLLERELLIATDKNADVRLPNGTAKVRIYIQDQLIYIEDIGSPDGILLNNMRIFSPNRLRSGDEVTIGAVILRFLF